jgi:hypothetical protein
MKTIAVLLAAATAFGSVAATQAEARPGYRPGHVAPHGRVYGYRGHRGGGAGAAAAVGIAGALIGGAAIAAASRHRDYYDAPPPPPYGYPAYGPAPGYYYDGY